MKKLIWPILGLILLGQGCVSLSGGRSEGGIFKSEDFADAWTQAVLIGTQKGRALTIGNVDVIEMTFDPNNVQGIFVGTLENGMYYSPDGAGRWIPMLNSTGSVRAIAVDPRNKNTVYASLGSLIYKSTDGAKTWKLIFNEPKNEPVYEIQIDPSNSTRVYAGIGNGQVIKSRDSGQSWTLIGNFEYRIDKIVINPKNTRIIYAATRGGGLFRSLTEGAEWENLKTIMNLNGDHNIIMDMAIEPNSPEKIIIASTYGILRSDNRGDSWYDLKLLTLPGTSIIQTLALNPKRPNEIIYATSQNTFKTRDGGRTWVSKPLPSQRIPSQLLIDPQNPQTVYLGVIKPQ